MSHLFTSAEELLIRIQRHGYAGIPDAVLAAEHELTGRSPQDIRAELLRRYQVMRQAVTRGLTDATATPKMVAPLAAKLLLQMATTPSFQSPLVLTAEVYSIAAMETNASMGRIVAAPTAGSSGILPGVLVALQEARSYSEEHLVDALLTTAGVGMIIASRATFSAAAAGCQAEIGASSAMAAAAIAQLSAATPEQCLHAAALALKNFLGLACDPVGGLVEIPCIKRNAFGVSHAFTACDLVRLGAESAIPFDEVVDAMNTIARSMHENIRETSRGGLAVTPTGKALKEKCFSCGLKDSCAT